MYNMHEWKVECAVLKAEELWESACRILQEEMTRISYSTWIETALKPCALVGDILLLECVSPVVQQMGTSRYMGQIQKAVSTAAGRALTVEVYSHEELKDRLKALEARSSGDSLALLNPKYTFDTFVVGSSNRFAHAVSLAVAEVPAKAYNPLFIYGGVGLGKTHLMNAIGNYVQKNDPRKNVLFITSETFTNELIDALRNGKTAGNESAMLNFRDKYRNIDVLLIDDIQFIIGKESTQEEFFHTFNHLHTLGKQIIISSDKPPKDIETLESRLRTRFEWGLIADISSPDYETRMAILQKKIELDHLEKYNIKNDVLDYIAANVKSNIRELEGSLNKLIALYKLNNNNNPIDIALAAEALKDIISSDNRREVTPELILDIVADHFGITVADLKSKKRDSEIAVPRQICMYLMRTMTDTALKGIGAVLGGKDHSTVKYGVEKIAKDIESDEMMANTINIIKKKINPA